MGFLEPITLAAPHIYLSALPFAPQNSKISMHFLKLFKKPSAVKMGQTKHWPEKCFLILEDHEDRVTSVAFSPDGRHIISGSCDKTVRVQDAQTGQTVMYPLKGHEDWVTSVAFSPDGRKIVSGSYDKTVRVWDAQIGQTVMNPLEGHENWVTSVAFSPDCRYIVSGSCDKTVRVWDAQTGQTVMYPLKGHEGWVTSVAFSPDCRHIISGSSDKTVRVWAAQTGQTVMKPLQGHEDWVTSVAFSPDGRHIVSGSHDKTIRVWDAEIGLTVMYPLRGHESWVTSVAFSPDGRHIVSGSCDKTVRVWDTQIGQPVMDPLKGHDQWVTSVAFSPDGRHIVSGSHDRTVRVWDAQTGQSVMDFFGWHDNSVTSVAFSFDGKHIVSGSLDKTVRVWDAQMGLEDPYILTSMANFAVKSLNQGKSDEDVELQPLHYQSPSPAEPIYFHSHFPFPNQSYPESVYPTTDEQNTTPHTSSMSSEPQAFPYAQSAFSLHAIQDTFTSSLKLHTLDEVKPPTDKSVIGKHFIIGAESALEGIQDKETVIETAFANFQISRSQYAVLAGFNEALMQSGTGYLLEIHIFCSVDITQTSESLVNKLGKILSPLPGALFTPSATYQIPVFHNDKTLLSWDEIVFSRTERYADIRSAVAPTSIQVVSCPQGSWSNSGMPPSLGFSGNKLKGSDSDKKDTDDAGDDESEDKKSGDNEGNDGNPDDDDSDDPMDGSLTSKLPVIYFDVQAQIYANTMDAAPSKVLQTLQVDGRLIIQVSCKFFSWPED